jgi:aldose 1-epimerase
MDALTLAGPGDLEMRVVPYGGTIVSLLAPDRHGRKADVVLGHDSLEDYARDTSYFGAIIGRYANRIAGARFTLDGKICHLTANEGINHLHGGRIGFDRVVWRAEPFRDGYAVGVDLSYFSPDGEEGYPGNLEVRARYTLTERNEVVVDFQATTDQPTPVNLTQHSCFNLAGADDILGHLLRIDAELMTPVDELMIPTGQLVPVGGSPFDFRTLTAIGARIDANNPQLRRARGYDHTFVLERERPGLTHAAQLVEPESGRTLDVYTTEPGLQLYSGNFIDGTVPGKQGRVYRPRSGLCLETQHFPDSPNQPGFPTTLLRPGQEYKSRTVFAFGVMT